MEEEENHALVGAHTCLPRKTELIAKMQQSQCVQENGKRKVQVNKSVASLFGHALGRYRTNTEGSRRGGCGQCAMRRRSERQPKPQECLSSFVEFHLSPP